MHNGKLKTAKITIVYDENELPDPRHMLNVMDEFLDILSVNGIIVHFDYDIKDANEEEKADYIKYTAD